MSYSFRWLHKLIAGLTEETYRIVDSTSPDQKTRSLALSLDGDETFAIMSIYWTESREKVYEKKFSSLSEAQSVFNLYKKDLEHAQELSKLEKKEEVMSFMDTFLQKLQKESDSVPQTNETPITTTMASKKEAKVVMQNIFFSSPEEAIAYQEKMKALQGPAEATEGLPEGTPEGEAPTLGDEIAPPATSYEDAEKEEAQKEKDIQKTIKEEVSDQIESALEQKIATQFTPKDRQLVEAMRGVGRTWEEIRDFMIKVLKYDKDTVAAYMDKLRSEEAPVEELPPTAPKPPEELVSPETHDKLVEEVESKLAEAKAGVEKTALDPLDAPPPVPAPEAPAVPAAETPATVEMPVAPQAGDRVYVLTDANEKESGVEADFISTFKDKGTDFAVIRKDNEEKQSIVPLHLVTKASLKKEASYYLRHSNDDKGNKGPFVSMDAAEQKRLLLPDKDDWYVTTEKGYSKASKKEAAEPATEVKPEVKFYKKTPPHVDPTLATPPSPEVEATYKNVQVAQHNLEMIRTMVEKAELQFQAKKKEIEEKGGRLENETKLQEQLNRLAALVAATDTKLISLGDELAHYKEDVKQIPSTMWTDKAKLNLLLQKFPEAQKHIDEAVAKSKELDTVQMTKELIIFPKRKLSKLHKINSLSDTLDSLSEHLLEALQALVA